MGIRRVIAIAVVLLAAVAGLHFWLNYDGSAARDERLPSARRLAIVAFIPVT